MNFCWIPSPPLSLTYLIGGPWQIRMKEFVFRGGSRLVFVIGVEDNLLMSAFLKNTVVEKLWSLLEHLKTISSCGPLVVQMGALHGIVMY